MLEQFCKSKTQTFNQISELTHQVQNKEREINNLNQKLSQSVIFKI